MPAPEVPEAAVDQVAPDPSARSDLQVLAVYTQGMSPAALKEMQFLLNGLL